MLSRARVLKGLKQAGIHKVILGREKFASGTLPPVSYEVSPFRGRS